MNHIATQPPEGLVFHMHWQFQRITIQVGVESMVGAWLDYNNTVTNCTAYI